MNTDIKQEITDYAIDMLEDIIDYNVTSKDTNKYACDLHHYIFNEDYYIIGTYKAEQWLEKFGTYKAINKVQEYEKEHFGEVSTNLGDPEKVANMLVYIIGEEILYDTEHIHEIWNETCTVEDIETIIGELKN